MCWRAVMCWISWSQFFITWMMQGLINVSRPAQGLIFNTVGKVILLLHAGSYSLVVNISFFFFLLFPARLGLMHIGVFILLLLSGERNFGRFRAWTNCLFSHSLWYFHNFVTTTESMKINLKFPIKQKILLIPRTSANITVMI